MEFPPIVVPQLLNEPTVLMYAPRTGDYTGSASQAQMTAAMCIAEQMAQDELMCGLVETTYTGSFNWTMGGNFSLPTVWNTRLIKVEMVQLASCGVYGACFGCGSLIGFNGLSYVGMYGGVCSTCSGAGEVSGGDFTNYAMLVNPKIGLVRLPTCTVPCVSSLRIAWTSGLPSSYQNSPQLLLALSLATKIVLEQIVQPEAAEGGPGSPGVEAFSMSGYSERRRGLMMTAFGDSAQANYIRSLLQFARIKRVRKLG